MIDRIDSSQPPSYPELSKNSTPSLGLTQKLQAMERKRTCLRWVAFGSSMLNCLCAGSILLYSLYAPIFQEKLGYSQMQVNAVSIAGELGMYLPVPLFGYICDTLGPAHLSLLSSFFFGPAYLLASYTYSEKLPYQFMVLAFVLIGMGTSGLYFSGVTTCAKNFTGSRGLALALPITAFGLSSLWEAQLVSRIFMGSDGKLLVCDVFVFFATLLVVVGVIGALGLRIVPVEEVERIDEDVQEAGEHTSLLRGNREQYGGGGSSDSAVVVAGEADATEKRWLNQATQEFLKDRTMWWFALGVFLVTGPGEAFINNMGTLIQTLYSPTTAEFKNPIDPATHVSLVALTSTIGRITAGSLSDYLAPAVSGAASPRRITCSRIYLISFASIIMLFGLLSVSLGIIQNHGERFWMVSTSIGAGYGAVFTLAPTIVSVVWGTENFGTNWGIIIMTPALGASLFGIIFAKGYDNHADQNGGICWGTSCYETAFVIMSASVIFALVGWMWAWRGSGGWVRRGVVV